MLGLNTGCGAALEVILATKSSFLREAECPNSGLSLSEDRQGDALPAAVAEGQLLAIEPIFLLKFMSFCSSVLHFIWTLAFQGGRP